MDFFLTAWNFTLSILQYNTVLTMLFFLFLITVLVNLTIQRAPQVIVNGFMSYEHAKELAPEFFGVSGIPRNKIIYKEVWIGGVAKEQLLQRLHKNHIHLNEQALNIINHKEFATLPSRKRLHTVEVSVKDLGFQNGAATEDIYSAAANHGLKLCPPELGPHMKLQYINLKQTLKKTDNNCQAIAIEKLTCDAGLLSGFYFDNFSLNGYSYSANHFWNPNDRFIFIV